MRITKRNSTARCAALPLTDTERRQLRAIVDYLKPAHTHFVDLIEPSLPPAFDHWQVRSEALHLDERRRFVHQHPPAIAR